MRTFLELAFRPFFLLAGLTAVALLPTWLLTLSGDGPPGIDLQWHAHELLFGFLGAVFAGFFLTAVPRWTGRPHVHGLALAALVALWGAARVSRALVVGSVGAVDALFLVVLAGAIAAPIVRDRSRRNAWFPLLLLAMAGADATIHLAPQHTLIAQRLAVLCALAVVTIFGGRITPLFTRGALRREGKDGVRERSWLDDAAIVSVLALVPLAVVDGAEPLVAGVAAVGAVLNALRMRGWRTQHTIRSPIVWILHAGYAWIPVSLALWAAAAVRPGLTSAAVHAMTAGVLGTYTLAMMSRVTLGHTGRPLQVHPAMVLSYACVLGAGLVRVGAPILMGFTPMWAINTAGVLWTAAFAIFVVVYTPILTQPGVDAEA